MKREKVLFLDIVHEVLWERLVELGYDCHEGYNLPYEEVKNSIVDYSGIVIRSRIPIDKELIDQGKMLKFIARSGAGMENIATECARSKNISCINSPEGNRDAVGEHAVAMLLSLFNHIPRANWEAKKGTWKREKNRGIELGGKTVGIIGYGNTGSSFARKLSGFGCTVLAYDKYINGITSEFAREAEMKEIFDESDIVSLHVPLTKETNYLFNQSFIEQFRKPIYLVNTSRGRVVNTHDLTEGLKSGKISGACLDVLEFEKSSFENLNSTEASPVLRYLAESDKVIITPHVAGWTNESYYKLSAFLADKIEAEFHS